MNLSVKNLYLEYKKNQSILNDISFEINNPSFVALLGPNGAGKTSLIEIITASLRQTKGKVEFDNKILLDNETEFKRKIGYLPQCFGLYDELTVYQFLDYMASLKSVKNKKEEILNILKKVNLLQKKNVRISNLSGGQRQRVGIAQALLGNSKMIILDEPTVGLDPEERINFRNIFESLSEEKIILLSTHIIEDIQNVCNRIIVINKGRIVFDGTSEEMMSKAIGHVGEFNEIPKEYNKDEYKITSNIKNNNKNIFRIVSLRKIEKSEEPTLEEAYIYLIISNQDDTRSDYYDRI